jgi:microcystin-dependent protein
MPVTINGTTGIVSPNYTGNGSVPVGSVYHFASSTAPTGFLICNGDAVPNGSGTVQGVTADFSALYAILGTTYGVAGTLPDLEGVFIRGTGSQTISGITYSGTLGAKQSDAFQGHAHSTDAQRYTEGPNQYQASQDYGDGANHPAASVGAPTAYLTYGTPRTASETRPANIALLPCIKY